jgi:hypothetical protein
LSRLLLLNGRRRKPLLELIKQREDIWFGKKKKNQPPGHIGLFFILDMAAGILYGKETNGWRAAAIN